MTWTTRPRSEGAGALQVWQAGTGPTVVLIHGVGLRAEAWASIMPHLTDHYAVHAVDMPGHGGSALEDTSDLSGFVDRIARYIQTLPQPVAVAGHSMGAIIALLLAQRGDCQIRALAALNAIFERTPEAAAAVQARADSLPLSGSADPSPTLLRWFGPAPQGDLLAAQEACRSWLTSANPLGYKTAYQAFAHQDGPSRAALAGLDIPALFMTAEGDGNSTPQMSQAMATCAPMAHAQTVADAAHMLPMTHGQIVAQALKDTFARAGHV